MKLKIICGQLEITPGRPDVNYKKIIDAIGKARSLEADILLLPENGTAGVILSATFGSSRHFWMTAPIMPKKIVAATENICVIFGSVASEPGKLNEDGRVRKYNAAFACQNGKLLGGYQGRSFFIKTSLPNYREFDDCRHFYSLQKLCAEEGASVSEALQPLEIVIRGTSLRIGVMLCEDGWTENYHLNVPQTLAANGAQLLCNLSCSPYTLGKNRKRNRLFSAQARTAGIPLIYCNNVGIQNNGKNIFTYDGCTSAYNGDGSLVTSAPMYADTFLEFTWDTKVNRIIPTCPPAELPQEPESVYRALRYGTAKFLQQCGIKRMTVGLSGGIDSAVTAVMYADILGPENVLLLNLPSRFNSAATRNSAQQLAQALGANYAVMPISESYELTVKQLEETPITNLADGSSFNLQLSGLIKENIQARDRGARVIAAASAAFGGAFSCNSNKAELAIGYATFYGDICGAMAMIGDLWKHQVYALGHYLNEVIYKTRSNPRSYLQYPSQRRAFGCTDSRQRRRPAGVWLSRLPAACLYRKLAQNNAGRHPALVQSRHAGLRAWLYAGSD